MRLIDADELLNELDRHAFDFGLDDLHMLEDVINDMPTVEQKHGHWQVVKECEAYFNECSNCKGRLWEVEPEWIFCPYCACKMDEVTEL